MPDSSPGRNYLEGRVAVVTGGAGSIGSAICVLFAEHGADIVVADKVGERVHQAVARVQALGRRAVPVVADLAMREGIDLLKQEALAAFDHVDVLVNGVGQHVGRQGPFEDSDEEQWQALYETNFLHVLRASKAFIPGMKERGWGRIVNFSSVEGMRGMPWGAVYSGFKGAINSFTRSAAVDLARHGILMNAIGVDKTKSYEVQFY